MSRIKVVNELAELVPILMAVDTDVKREVFKEVSAEWKTLREVEEKYGQEGKDALLLFEKMKLVETRWQSNDTGPKKAYHTYYTSFHIDISCPVGEISDALSAAMLNESNFKKIEDKILKDISDDGRFAGDIAEELDITPTMLKSIVKRSAKLDYRGHRVERFKEE